MTDVASSGSYPAACYGSNLQLSVTRVAGLILLLLVSAHLPVSAQERHQWINPDLSVYTDLPIEVRVGVQIDQITHVNQRAENFGAVGYLRMEWHDPNLAFDPPPDEIPVRRYDRSVFSRKADDENIFFPTFSIYNQQGRRFSDESGVVVFPDGRAVFAERFSATLQAPDFDFKSYPFDKQRFFISIETQWSDAVMHFVADPEFSGIGDQLGEEEWVFHWEGVEITTQMNIIGRPASRITFTITARRHIWYYVLRIIIPLIIIVVVSWATFFLRDFSKRVDVSGGNLLVYVAFNFTISNDLPRLGYLTFIDTILAAAFIITGLTVIWSVLLRRLELNGRERVARIIDVYTLWVYPCAFLLVIFFAWSYFFHAWTIRDLLSPF